MQGGLCKRVYAVQELWDDLLEEFAENAAACLLFLKKMQRIVVHSLTHGGRREVCFVHTRGVGEVCFVHTRGVRRRGGITAGSGFRATVCNRVV